MTARDSIVDNIATMLHSEGISLDRSVDISEKLVDACNDMPEDFYNSNVFDNLKAVHKALTRLIPW